eukprot:11611204-Alexandrium_andersonii.AAC.1
MHIKWCASELNALLMTSHASAAVCSLWSGARVLATAVFCHMCQSAEPARVNPNMTIAMVDELVLNTRPARAVRFVRRVGR